MDQLETDLKEAELVVRTVAALWQYIQTLPTDPAQRIAALEATIAQIDALLVPPTPTPAPSGN